MNRRGLTLIELVVVLTILAVLSVTVLSATSGLADDARFDASRRTLEGLRGAVLGSSPSDRGGVDGFRGFVADMGRLPRVGTDLEPRELLVAPAAPRFGPATPEGDGDLVLSCGWRGPYLRLPIGAGEIRDGWGRPFRLLDEDGLEVDAQGDSIGSIVCLGSDDLAGGSGYAIDLADCVFRGEGDDRAHGSLVAHVLAPATTDAVLVRVYGPSDGRAVTLGQEAWDPGAPSPSEGLRSVRTHSDEAGRRIVTATFPDLPIGPKLVRAYLVPPTGNPDAIEWTCDLGQASTDPCGTARGHSLARRVDLGAGGAVVELSLSTDESR